MSKKKNIISAKSFADAAGDIARGIEVIDWNGLKLEIKHYLTIEEVREFVNIVVGCCFDDEGAYTPEYKEFAIASAAVEMYTNVTLPTKAKKIDEILEGTDLFDLICKNIDIVQFDAIVKAADDKIRYLRESNIKMIEDRANRLIAAFNDILAQFGEVFGGISKEDIDNLAHALSENGIDEQKLMQAYLNETKREQ